MYYDLQDINPSTTTVTLYVEYLAQHFTAHKSVQNYVSGVRLLHKLLGIDAPALYSFDLALMLRATKLTMTAIPQQKLPITPSILSQLCHNCAGRGEQGIILRCAIVFAFFGFLRISNLAPQTSALFNPRKHTCRGDIIIVKGGLRIMLKWTKTIRMGSQPQLISLPALPHNQVVCPVNAYNSMLHVAPTASPNDPLLYLPRSHHSRQVFTISQLSAYFAELLAHSGLDPAAYSIHSL